MRRLKTFLLALMAVLLLLPADIVEATNTTGNSTSEEQKKETDTGSYTVTGNISSGQILQLPSGTTEAVVTIELKDLQSLEGEIILLASMEGTTITLDQLTASSDEGALCMAEGNKVFLVAPAKPVSLKVTVGLKFSGDGKYELNFDGGITDAKGNYTDFAHDGKEETCIMKVSIGVGVSVGDVPPAGGDNGDNNTEDNNTDDNTEDTEDNNTDDSAGDNTGNDSPQTPAQPQTGTTGDKVDYSALEQALSDAKDAVNSDESLKVMQDLVNKTNEGTVLLDSENQEDIDKAAQEIQQSINELENQKDQTADTANSGGKKGSLLLKVILAILLVILVAFNLLYFLVWKKRKNKKRDYDGAPMVDYDINEDDDMGEEFDIGEDE